MQKEAVTKLLSGVILGFDERLLETRLTLRGGLEEQQAKLDEARTRLDALPHRRRYLLLVHELGNALLRLQHDWLDQVEKELGQPDRPPAPAEKAEPPGNVR
jgi:hypothetical protein